MHSVDLSFKKGLPNDVLRSRICDWVKSTNFDKTKGYSLAIFSEIEVFWQLALRAYNFSLEHPFSKIKVTFCSF